jgi:hypothetical protein
MIMRTLKVALAQAAALGALFLVSAVPALALELPDVHVLSGETYPTLSEGSVEGLEVGTLETELGEKLTASKVTVAAELLELSALGPDTLIFTGVTEPKSKVSCNTAGDAAGTVKFGGEYHVVDTSTAPLTAALLALFKELVMECNSGKLKIKVRSPAVLKLEKVTSGTDLTSYGLVAKCTGKGKQELKAYLNDAGETVKGVLTSNFGLGFESACENISKELVVKANKMLDFLF